MYIIDSNDIKVRLLKDSDKELLLKWLSNEDVQNYYGGHGEYDEKRIEEVYYTNWPTEIIRVIIEYKGKNIGSSQIYYMSDEISKSYNYDTNGKKVYAVDTLIGEKDYWNKGIETEYLKLVLEYLKDNKNADIVLIGPHKDNQELIDAYTNAGFKRCTELIGPMGLTYYIMEHKF